jgi:tRNA threonylcarbamoyl adenosine modification protein YeaZ
VAERATDGLLVAMDTASDIAGVAVTEGGVLLGEVTWYARQSHSRQLLPALDWLLAHSGRNKEQVSGLAVCLGPGSYAGMRVGLSTAKALAYALDVPIVGVGRLEAEALPLVEATGGRVVPIQAAGRAELAWALYDQHDGKLVELAAPRLGPIAELLSEVQPGDVLTGDIDRLDAETVSKLERDGCRLVTGAQARVVGIARLGFERLRRGDGDEVEALLPLYLRAPAIGPQPPR